MSTYLLEVSLFNDLVLISLIVILVTAAVVFVATLRTSKATRNKVVAFAVIIVLLIVVPLFVFVGPVARNSVTVSQGEFSASAPPFFSTTVRSDQIKEAFVVNLNTWNVTIAAKTSGTSLGDYNAGYFLLSNGATADVLTDGQTNLIVLTSSGLYFILGPSDFQAFVTDFSSQVVPVSNSSL